MTNQDLFKQDDFNQQYALAKEIDDKRFGSECKHTETKGGYCTNCLRKVVSLTSLFREPCRRCHVVHTYTRDRNNIPLCQSCAEKELTLIFSHDSQQKGYFSVVNPQEHLYRDFGIATQFSPEEWFAWSVNARQQGFTFQVLERSQS